MTEVEFFARYNDAKSSIYIVCAGFGKKYGQDMIDEYMQIVLIKLWMRRDYYRVDDNYRAWACMVARNTLINFVRREARYNEIFNKELIHSDIYKPVQAPSPDEALMQKYAYKEVMEHLSDLIPEYRDVVIMSELKDMSYKEIAEQLDIPVGTVMSRLYRGRKALCINPRSES